MRIYDSYEDALLTEEWEKKREEILLRDNYKCSKCSKVQYENGVYTPLHVHHKVYYSGKLPWQYENDTLITLCKECHKKEHGGNVEFYQKSIKRLINWKTLNPQIDLNELHPSPFEIRVSNQDNKELMDYMYRAYSNYFYKTTLVRYDQSFDLGVSEHNVFRAGSLFIVFHKQSIHTFLTIYDAIQNRNYRDSWDLNKQSDNADYITIGYNNGQFQPILIWGIWVRLQIGFHYFLTDKNDNKLISTKRVGNNYINEPAKSDYIEFFLENHHTGDLEHIINCKISEKVPYMMDEIS